MHAQLQTNTNTAIKIPGLVVLIYIVKSDILSVIQNDEGSELCAVDGWIYEGWEHVTGTLSKLFG